MTKTGPHGASKVRLKALESPHLMVVRPSRRRLTSTRASISNQVFPRCQIHTPPYAVGASLESRKDATPPLPSCLRPHSSAPLRVSGFLGFASCLLYPFCHRIARAECARLLPKKPGRLWQSVHRQRRHDIIRTTASLGNRYFVAAAGIPATSFVGSRHAF
ncbi:uncharacterized protein LY79DRAFT_128458 [Colletotrichum navitas]|uniref:Uncharacterized protein n=1 Tax=Colletotrichum navitas TaxID=681940 RepID=A0AAD8Q317_9PEZI|nr:uncharacterized protein LY79DRAFT_128458 [Colletotrichum navitas]KAK1594863.1 hypothetical protein LY79DRAFT_128458 [Colletotrichum navitas]